MNVSWFLYNSVAWPRHGLAAYKHSQLSYRSIEDPGRGLLGFPTARQRSRIETGDPSRVNANETSTRRGMFGIVGQFSRLSYLILLWLFNGSPHLFSLTTTTSADVFGVVFLLYEMTLKEMQDRHEAVARSRKRAASPWPRAPHKCWDA